MRRPETSRMLFRGLACVGVLLMLACPGLRAQVDPDEPDVNLRIAFGEGVLAERGSFLSVVYLENAVDDRRADVCGGSVIDDRWVLTAAHCVQRPDGKAGPTQPDRLTVLAGTQTIAPNVGHAIGVTDILVHPGYQFSVGSPHDVALLHLASPTNVPRQILDSAAARAELERPGQTAIVAGFGRTEHGERSHDLLRAELPVLAENDCRQSWRGVKDLPPGALGSATLCAGAARPMAGDACSGDSGGPLMVRAALGDIVQIGIVSWGSAQRCGATTHPTVFASVADHADWIRRHVPNARFEYPQTASAAPASAPSSMTPASEVVLPPMPPPPAVRPSAMPQLSLDILQGNTLRVGTQVTIRLGSSIAGNLVVFVVNAAGDVRQIAPNQFSGQGGAGEVRRRVRAGEVTLLPGLADGFEMTARAPLGPTRVIGLVLPDAPGVREAINAHLDLRPIPDGTGYIQHLTDLVRAEVTRSVQVVAKPVTPPNVAMAEASFTVVP